ncbi:hypothetical protein [Tabrizicola sp.]|uniref:hypothetical protein n=1 Tax=Tabrizicola sp. TaxID=2005166 RepID=UPI003F399638
MDRARFAAATGALLGLAMPVHAECLGQCLDGLATAIGTIVIYGLLGLVILVMLIWPRLRRLGLYALAATGVIALGVPLLSQGWLAWKLRAMEGREVVGAPPAMSERTPLVINLGWNCQYDPCGALLMGRGRSGVYALPRASLEGLDLTRPVALADLPLEFWSHETDREPQIQSRPLSPQERAEAASRIDYVVIISAEDLSWPNARSQPGIIEAILRSNPALKDMRSGEMVRFAMAPLDPAEGVLVFVDLRFDLLDLWLADRALAMPLAPRSSQSARNRIAGRAEAGDALCPYVDGVPGWTCLSLYSGGEYYGEGSF